MALEYRVAWPAVSLHLNGVDVILDKGARLPSDLDDNQRTTLAAMGAVHVVEVAAVGDFADIPAETATDRPLKRASKAEWAAYAVTVGIPPADAAGMTKEDLIAAIEASSEATETPPHDQAESTPDPETVTPAGEGQE
mgnify:CR=1 FL=1